MEQTTEYLAIVKQIFLGTVVVVVAFVSLNRIDGILVIYNIEASTDSKYPHTTGGSLRMISPVSVILKMVLVV